MEVNILGGGQWMQLSGSDGGEIGLLENMGRFLWLGICFGRTEEINEGHVY